MLCCGDAVPNTLAGVAAPPPLSFPLGMFHGAYGLMGFVFCPRGLTLPVCQLLRAQGPWAP